jgi:hypothetical protein
LLVIASRLSPDALAPKLDSATEPTALIGPARVAAPAEAKGEQAAVAKQRNRSTPTPAAANG